MGLECLAFCATRFEAAEEVFAEQFLARQGLRNEVVQGQIGPYAGRMFLAWQGKVSLTLFQTVSTRGGWRDETEAATFLAACEIFLARQRPDVVWTYGGDAVSIAVQHVAKRLDLPVLFALHDFACRDPQAFKMTDYVVVPTESCRQHYWKALGLASLKLPLVVDPGRVQFAERRPRYATFVDPEPRKGLFVFARIAEVLARRRPDIPLALVEGTSKAGFLADRSGAGNLRIVPNSPDARRFLAATKLLLMPSLTEDGGLTAMEAMLNGIPVLASNRGGLPETIGDAGFLFDIPARCTPETRDALSAEDVEPWVETIVRLWDDAAEYERWSRAARERSQTWRAERLGPVYRDFFSHLTHQPGPPLVPREIARG